MVVLNEVKNMFWGVTLDAGKRYTQTVRTSFHVSCAALEVGAERSQGPMQRVAVMLQHEKVEFLVCTLDNKINYQQALDLNFTEGEELSFFLNGQGIVHLTGYLVPEDTNNVNFGNFTSDMGSEDDDSDDSDEEKDDSDEEIPTLQEIAVPSGKRKRTVTEMSPKKRKKGQEAEESDDLYNSEDDEDSDEDPEFSAMDLDLMQSGSDGDDSDDDSEDDSDEDDSDEDDSDEDDSDEDADTGILQQKPKKKLTPKKEQKIKAEKTPNAENLQKAEKTPKAEKLQKAEKTPTVEKALTVEQKSPKTGKTPKSEKRKMKADKTPQAEKLQKAEKTPKAEKPQKAEKTPTVESAVMVVEKSSKTSKTPKSEIKAKQQPNQNARNSPKIKEKQKDLDNSEDDEDSDEDPDFSAVDLDMQSESDADSEDDSGDDSDEEEPQQKQELSVDDLSGSYLEENAKDKIKTPKKQLAKAEKSPNVEKAGKSPKTGKTPKSEKKAQQNGNVQHTSPSKEKQQPIGNGTATQIQEGKKKKKKKEKGQENKAAADQPKKAKKVVLAGGTVAEDIKQGHGPEAKSGKMVHVYYKGMLKDGTVFDACTSGVPFKFKLGKREVITGWDTGLQGMTVGSKRKLTIPAKQAYGSQRVGTIPPNSTLHFEVELKAVS